MKVAEIIRKLEEILEEIFSAELKDIEEILEPSELVPLCKIWSSISESFLESFFNRYSINETEIALKEVKNFVDDKKIECKTYKEYREKRQNLFNIDVRLVLLQEFYDQSSLRHNKRKELHKKDMIEIRNFYLVNKEHRNDFLCFLGNKFFPNNRNLGNDYESLPGSLREYFFSNFICRNNYLKNDLQTDHKKRSI